MTSTQLGDPRQDTPKSASGPGSPADWLPYVTTPAEQAKVPYGRVAQSLKRRNWFMAFICAAEEAKKDGGIQGKILFKLYYFLRHHIPDGFTGDWAHIKGNLVMEQLLCHAETTPSRHRVAKHADAAFTELERWMGRHKDWRAALRGAKEEYEKQKRAGVRKRTHWQAPGLHTPAGMTAVLVLAHPDDTKFKKWVGRLGIEWMMKQPQALLKVQEGFWKGINSSNLYEVFESAPLREAEVPLLADYDEILGEGFTRSLAEIRPKLPTWAQDIVLSDQPSSDGSDSSDDDEDIVNEVEEPAEIPDAEVVSLSKHLSPPTPVDTSGLETWLSSNLALAQARGGTGDSSVLIDWIRHWDKRVQTVENVLQEKIVRELFIQSLHRLNSMFCSDANFSTPYMLADMADEQARHLSPDATEILGPVSGFRTLRKAQDRLKHRLQALHGGEANSLVSRVFESQTRFLLDVFQSHKLFKYRQAVMNFETTRLHVLYKDVSDSPEAQVHERVPAESTIATIKLTDWQLCSLLLPGGSSPLTSSQSDARSRIEKGLHIQDDLLAAVDHIGPAPGSTAAVTLKNLFKSSKSTNGGRGASPSDSEQGHLPSDDPIYVASSPSPRPVQPPTRGPSHTTPGPGPEPGHSTPCPATSQSPAMNGSRRSDHGPVTPGPSEDTSRWSGPANPQPGRSAFAGLTSRKRRTSSGAANGQSVKAPRLDVRDMLKADRNQLSEDIKSDLRAEFQQLRDHFGEQIKSSVNGLLDKMDALSDSLMVGCVQAIREEMKAQASQIGRLEASTKSDFEAQTSKIDGLKKELTSSTARLQAVESQATKLGDLTTDLKADLQSLSAKFVSEVTGHAAPGQHGFLSQQCPAPTDGWAQHDYEIQLERAAWSYICHLGNPDDGVEPDEEALERTTSMFPGLNTEHIISAIQHVHMRVWRCPFGRADTHDGLDAEGIDGALNFVNLQRIT